MTRTFILDGIFGRPRRWRRLQRELTDSCGPAETFAYDGSGRVPFEELGSRFHATLRQQSEPMNVIGFSMGGLVIRAAHMIDASLPIRRAVFINSPHRGSWLAYVLPLAGVRQLRPNSDFLRRLDGVKWTIPTLAVWCPGDLAVIPGCSARWNCATEFQCCYLPVHPWPIYSRRLRRRMVEFLEKGAVPGEESVESHGDERARAVAASAR